MSRSNLEYLDDAQTPIGLIGLRRREPLSLPGTVLTEITLDHQLLMTSYNTVSERALARCAIAMHGGAELRVLVGGLGLGYTAREALASDRVARVEVVERLPQVIGWLDRGLLPLAAELSADARFAVCEGDVYARLAGTPEREHDLVLVDVDHSPEERLDDTSEPFYGEAGLRRAGRHLAPGGVLGVWSYSESPALEASLRRAFADVRVEHTRFDNRLLDEIEVSWLYFARQPR